MRRVACRYLQAQRLPPLLRLPQVLLRRMAAVPRLLVLTLRIGAGYCFRLSLKAFPNRLMLFRTHHILMLHRQWKPVMVRAILLVAAVLGMTGLAQRQHCLCRRTRMLFAGALDISRCALATSWTARGIRCILCNLPVRAITRVATPVLLIHRGTLRAGTVNM